MSACPKCKLACAPEATDCAACGVVFARFKPRDAERIAAMRPPEDLVPKRGIPWSTIGVAVAVLGVVAWMYRPKWFPLDRLTSVSQTAPAACTGAEKCVLVYIAPWCPACKATLPIMREVSQSLKASGLAQLVIVVGMDAPQNLTNLAKTLGPEAYLDETGEIAKKLDIQSVPQWITINQSGRIVQQLAGTVPVAHFQMERLALR